MSGEGVQGQKLWEQDFEIKTEPKAPKRGPTFWSDFKAPDPEAPAWQVPNVSQKRPKNRNWELTDKNSFLISKRLIIVIRVFQKIQPDWPKNGKNRQNTYAHIWNNWYF